jgi:hypothetical protein
MPVLASADWLITHDGKKIETSGAWKVKDQKVYFRRPNGSLVSVPVRVIDLDRSASASRAASSRKGSTQKPQRRKSDDSEPALILTNKDVGRYQEPARSTRAEGTSSSTPGPLAVRSEHAVGDLEISEWEESLKGNTLVVTGTLLNRGQLELKDVSLSIRIFDDEDKELARVRQAELEDDSSSGPDVLPSRGWPGG